MHFNILTIFPDMFPGTLAGGVVGRALEKKIWTYDVVNIRDFAINNYGSVDDTQFGGGAGMVMRPDALGDALDSVKQKGKIIYFSPRGVTLNQRLVREFVSDADAKYTLLCGRYEGIDERIIEEYDIIEVSIGDYILSGGEIAAQVFIDSCVRLLDNVVHGGRDTTENESFEIGGLEWPLYTRPSVWRGRSVPEVLLSGHHGNIERWRKQQSVDITKERRPDLIKENEK
ncbi:MAG: tRNA (guanosine(37)-N1)-methyltransferase TrmD [Alphaproteobacteria bacterium]|nr:tRNA (guanosine(37)-N1)-methyltransferase TrmD [Alphaproteobacteria bacterium]MBR6685727.1 tRNA (guanosine(37)-N1)-methyltransferase TrmD [Alphaproteobacteria bacterium]